MSNQKSLRIMTYNILNGGVGRETLVLEVIQTQQPDIIVLQEVYDVNFVRQLAGALGMNWFFAEGNTKRHLGLLSRLPIVSAQSHRPFPIWRAILEAQLEIAPNRYLWVLGVHTKASPSIMDEVWRWREVNAIIKRAQLRPVEPFAILGDFNAIAPADHVNLASFPLLLKLVILLQGWHIYRFSLRAMHKANFTDCFRVLHAQADGFTLPPPQPNARLDYIFINALMKPHLKNCFVVREPLAVEKASDHYPVLAEFEF